MKRILGANLAACGLLACTAAGAAVDFNLASLRSDGTPPSLYSDGTQQPAITPDGRYVVFVADAPTLTPIGASGFQVYLRDRTLGLTELVSVSTTGGGGNGSSSVPSISDDGCRVAFNSFSSNLVAGDANGLPDVFVRDRCAGPATSLVSRSTAGTQGNAASAEGRISGNGTRVVFVSNATNLATVTNSGFSCLFRRDLDSGTTTAIATAAGVCIVAAVPDISADASRVAFWASLSPGTSSTVNGVWQIYLYDFAAAAGSQPVVVSTSEAGVPQSQGSEGTSTVSAPAISPDGGYVVFASRGDGLVPVDGGVNYHVYVKELSTGVIVRASVDSAGNLGNGDSSGVGSGLRPGVSNFANTVTFLSSATNLAPQTGGFFPNVIAHNPYTVTTIGFTAAETLNGRPAISANGDLIVANSLFQLDPAFASRGMFTFAGLKARSVNISTRMQVLTGNDVMIGGFIVGGVAAKQVVIRARGPSLAGFVPSPLANPTLRLVRSAGQVTIATNDNWQAAANAADITASGFAPSEPLESAVLATLDPGAYTAIVEGAGGTSGVGIVEVFEVDRTESPLINISTRGQVLTGNDVMIGGFVVEGTDPQTVVIRARGPSLAGFVPGPLANPTLRLVRSADQATIATNDDWGTAANAAELSASGFAPSEALESAILITLPPGAYTAIVSGVGGGTGVGIVEVFAQ